MNRGPGQSERNICVVYSLQWCHNERDGVSNHQPHDCLLSRLFRRRSKKTSNSASLALVRGIHRWPMNSPHKGPVTRRIFHLMTSSCYVKYRLKELGAEPVNVGHGTIPMSHRMCSLRLILTYWYLVAHFCQLGTTAKPSPTCKSKL